METDESDAPYGLNMSLDQIIAENSKSRGKPAANRAPQAGKHHSVQGSRGRGRGGRSRGRVSNRGGRTLDRGGRGQQLEAPGYAQSDRIVMVQEQAPSHEYRQVAVDNNNQLL